MEELSRPRSSTIIHQPEEAFNVQSEERQSLISELKEITQMDTIKASLWACIQVCDISKLREIVDAARTTPAAFFPLLEDNCLSIPLSWMQRAPRDLASTPSTTASSASNARRPLRPERPKRLSKERDQACVLTKASIYQVAHISPHCMINGRPPRNLEGSIPDFWRLLEFFFEPDRLNSWRAQIFLDPANPHRGIDGCHNVICLSNSAHELWARGLFALRPISLSSDRKELTVEFHWQPRLTHGRFDSVDLRQSPISSRGLVHVERNSLHVPNGDGDATSQIKSGDTFALRTVNPSTHPLPSFGLLEMQWHLNRIVSMSGAADIYDDDDDDDHHFDGVVYKSSDTASWVSSLSSFHAFEDDDDRLDHTMTTVSSYPSPHKIR